jgi:PBP1b-binding outer membrane lipoprotein LpoB
VQTNEEIHAMKMRLVATAVGLTAALSACSATSTTTYQAYTSDAPAPRVAVYDADDPVPRAQPVEIAAAGPSVLNSDNKPVQLRSGLNSDPNNPNGAPGGGASFNVY